MKDTYITTAIGMSDQRRSERNKNEKTEKTDFSLSPPLQLTERLQASTPSKSISAEELNLDKEISEMETSIRQAESQLEDLEAKSRLRAKQDQDRLSEMKKQLDRKQKKLKSAQEEGEKKLLTLLKLQISEIMTNYYMYHFLNFDTQFDIIVMWSLILLMFFLMATKSNMVPNAAHQFDAKKQLTRGDIKVYYSMLIVNIKWSKTRLFGYLHEIPISAISKSCLCPVQAYKNMLSCVPATANDPAFCVSNKNHLLSFSKKVRTTDFFVWKR